MAIRDEPALSAHGAFVDFSANENNSFLFEFKTKITSKTKSCSTKDVKIMALLKYLRNFWRILKCH